MKVLIADNSYEAVRLADELTHAGYCVITRPCKAALIKAAIKKEKPDVIVSCFVTEEVAKANKAKLTVLAIKNYSTEKLIEKLVRFSHSTDKNYLEAKATDELKDFNLFGHLDGYRYIIEAVVIASLHRELSGITKTVYPEIAKECKTTPACVERSIRHAIELAWNRKKASAFFSALGLTSKPTNKKLIHCLAEKILAELGVMMRS